MQLTTHGRTISLTHTPGMHWLLGGGFVVLGIIGAAAPFGLATGVDALRRWELLVIALIGACSAGAGIWLLARSPRSALMLDLESGRGRLQRRGLAMVETTEFAVDGIDAVELEHSKDDDGGDIYRPALRLRDGTRLIVSTVWMHHGPQEAVATLSKALARPVVRS